MPHAIQNVTANGLRFAYLAEGDGPLVLMVHGFPDTARSWDHLRPLVAAKGFRAVSPWTRGYHPTEIPMQDADGRTLADDVAALIDALAGGEKAIVIGHDWGALAAYGVASLHPEKVAKLITVAIPHPASMKPSLGKAWGVRHFLAYKLPGAAARFAKDDFAALNEIVHRWSPAWSFDASELEPVKESFRVRASLEAAMGYYRKLGPLPSYLKQKIAVDTVAFGGTDDPLLSPEDYEDARRMFTGSYVVETMPGGHFLHREHPDTFAEKLLPHLAS
ncbi:MAG: alpha/beta fold hydrolase [Sandaracinaceae bacterium]